MEKIFTEIFGIKHKPRLDITLDTENLYLLPSQTNYLRQKQISAETTLQYGNSVPIFMYELYEYGNIPEHEEDWWEGESFEAEEDGNDIIHADQTNSEMWSTSTPDPNLVYQTSNNQTKSQLQKLADLDKTVYQQSDFIESFINVNFQDANDHDGVTNRQENRDFTDTMIFDISDFDFTQFEMIGGSLLIYKSASKISSDDQFLLNLDLLLPEQNITLRKSVRILENFPIASNYTGWLKFPAVEILQQIKDHEFPSYHIMIKMSLENEELPINYGLSGMDNHLDMRKQTFLIGYFIEDVFHENSLNHRIKRSIEKDQNEKAKRYRNKNRRKKLSKKERKRLKAERRKKERNRDNRRNNRKNHHSNRYICQYMIL